MTTFQIVTAKATKAEVFTTTDPVAEFEARGYRHTGPLTAGHVREELRRKPKFEGLAGPMWGGTTAEGDAIIRYEDWATYNFLCT